MIDEKILLEEIEKMANGEVALPHTVYDGSGSVSAGGLYMAIFDHLKQAIEKASVKDKMPSFIVKNETGDKLTVEL